MRYCADGVVMEYGILVIVKWIKRDCLSSAASAYGRVESGFENAGDVEGRNGKCVWRNVQCMSRYCI